VVFRCRTGLLNFAVPLIPDGLSSYCLLGGGVREQSVNLALLESLARSAGVDAIALLSKLEELPVVTMSDLKETAAKVHKIISSSQKDYLHSRLLDKTEDLLKTVTAISVQLDNCGTEEEAVQLLGEALGILFDLPKIAIVLQDADEDNFSVRTQSGMSGECPNMPGHGVRELFLNNPGEYTVLTGKNIKHFFPGADSASALFLPIQSGDELMGFLALFDAELHQRDIQMVELLIGRLSSKLLLVRKEGLHARGNSLTDKLISLVDSISSAKSKSELFRHILDASADILQASTGSLMLVEENGRDLHIESAIGLDPRIAQSLKLEIGSGISGKVAASGEPMLVDNIEEDERTRIRNRRRFKTKSFLSAPLRVKGKIIGVVNLSDRKNGGTFTGQDLDVLCSLLGQAALAIERTVSEERAERLEQLSMADPVTGLFNQRFLELRLEEELNRSGRHEESLAVMSVDLDNFRAYNDICGGSAGDTALKKTALLLKAASRQMDTVTRVAGGRFCLIVPGASRSESFIVAERIRSKIESAAFPHEDKLATGFLTASIGISLFPENGDSVETLLQSADKALERAKIAGRNRVVQSAAEMKGGNKVVPIHTTSRQG
jgi:diguanylate cyclase (GGDEF)-like protein